MTHKWSAMPTMAASDLSDEDGVTLLIEMDDQEVKRQVGATFVAQMQDSPRVHHVFFQLALPPLRVVTDPVVDNWLGGLASALVALALAQTSSHGFRWTVNPVAAQAFLAANLAPSTRMFSELAWSNYEALFPAYAQHSNVSYASFLGGVYGDRQRWGRALADRLASRAYIDQEWPKLTPGVGAGGWYQVLLANLYKVTRLDSSQRQRVVDAWQPHLPDSQLISMIPWTYYDHMLASSYNGDTFMGAVQSAVAITDDETRTLGCQGGLGAHCTTETTTTFGAAVNRWLGDNRGLCGFILGPTSRNTESKVHT